jgi:hypothetical protein
MQPVPLRDCSSYCATKTQDSSFERSRCQRLAESPLQHKQVAVRTGKGAASLVQLSSPQCAYAMQYTGTAAADIITWTCSPAQPGPQ